MIFVPRVGGRVSGGGGGRKTRMYHTYTATVEIVYNVYKKGSNGRFMRRDFNHEHWLADLDKLDMTHGGSGGSHVGSGEPHEGSGGPKEGHMSAK